MTGSKPNIVACIPAYNEEKNIASVIIRTLRFVDRVYVCDDGSTDLTGDISRGLGAVVVRHDRNMGKGAALRDLFKSVIILEPGVVVSLDADQQHDPEDIPRVVEPILRNQADMVIGSRFVAGSKTDAPLYRRLGLRLIDAFSVKSGNLGVSDSQSGFRAFSSKALDVVVGCKAEGYGVETEQLALVQRFGLRVLEVPVTIRYGGLEGTSKKNPAFHGFELVDTVLRLVVVERPLLYLALPGTVLSLLGIGFGIFFLRDFNLTHSFNVTLAFVSVGAVFLGMLLIVSSMIIYAIKSIGSRATSE